MREIIFYQKGNGRSPVEEFLDELNATQAQKVLWVLKLIEELEDVPTQYFKKLVNTDDIWKVRALLGNNTFRMLGFLDGENIVILTNGFAKKSQKTPRKEIALAQQRKKEYLEDRK